MDGGDVQASGKPLYHMVPRASWETLKSKKEPYFPSTYKQVTVYLALGSFLPPHSTDVLFEPAQSSVLLLDGSQTICRSDAENCCCRTASYTSQRIPGRWRWFSTTFTPPNSLGSGYASSLTVQSSPHKCASSPHSSVS